MIGFSDIPRIFIGTEPVDCRCGINRLSSIIFASFCQDPFDGSLYIFTNKRRNVLKCVYWDGISFWLLTRRLEKGTFQWKKSGDSCAEIDHQQLELLLKGMMFESPASFTQGIHACTSPAAIAEIAASLG